MNIQIKQIMKVLLVPFICAALIIGATEAEGKKKKGKGGGNSDPQSEPQQEPFNEDDEGGNGPMGKQGNCKKSSKKGKDDGDKKAMKDMANTPERQATIERKIAFRNGMFRQALASGKITDAEEKALKMQMQKIREMYEQINEDCVITKAEMKQIRALFRAWSESFHALRANSATETNTGTGTNTNTSTSTNTNTGTNTSTATNTISSSTATATNTHTATQQNQGAQ